jgi:hypothetical protein
MCNVASDKTQRRWTCYVDPEVRAEVMPTKFSPDCIGEFGKQNFLSCYKAAQCLQRLTNIVDVTFVQVMSSTALISPIQSGQK